jgi:hypothetical protein
VKIRARLAAGLGAGLLLLATASAGDTHWCLGMGGLGPIRAGMAVDDVLPLLGRPVPDGNRRVEECGYLQPAGGGADFRLMIIGVRVVRIELTGQSTLRTFAGVRIGTDESELRRLYGPDLESQPHKYDEHGRTLTLRSGAGSGDHGLRFETSRGKVTAIQAGPWEHLNYVEGCS